MLGLPTANARTSAAFNAFGKRLHEYGGWREELARTLGEYQTWVESEGLGSGEDDLRVYELVDALRADKLVVAFAGEFSRGKTELINAIFFADFKQRLLPSETGRTTLCPTELRYDEGEAPALRLLPIESRATALTLAEYKRRPGEWHVHPLDLARPRDMASMLARITETRLVSADEAQALGLYQPRAAHGPRPLDGKLPIPAWRHAIINFPHPLLQQGLVVLDTPGLNALGAEPELTLSVLASAHAVLFVLAADAGVSRSDLEVWTSHVLPATRGAPEGRLVVLNKADALWDELHTPEAIAAALGHQTEAVARILEVGAGQVFAVSAQKGLLGRIKADRGLTARSGVEALERRLAIDVVGAKQELMRGQVLREIGPVIERARAVIGARLAAVEAQHAELAQLAGKGRSAVASAMERMRAEKLAYERALATFQTGRAALAEQTRLLLDDLGVERFDALAERTRADMTGSWTTQGLRRAMKQLFAGADAILERARAQAGHITALARAAYAQLQAEHRLADLEPPAFPLASFREQLGRVQDEAEAFRRSPLMVVTEQHFVIRRFLITLGSRARLVFEQAHIAARDWSRALVAPMLAQLREHKSMIDRRLDNLNRVHDNLDELGERMAELERDKQNLENQLAVIDNILRRLQRPVARAPSA